MTKLPSTTHLLARRPKELGVKADLFQWMIRFKTGRKVTLVLDGKEGEVRKVEAWIACSPGSLHHQSVRDC